VNLASKGWNQALITKAGFERVTSFIPRLESLPAEEVVPWPELQKTPDGRGIVLPPGPDYHPDVIALMDALNECGFVQSFDWPAWKPEAEKFISTPQLVRGADIETCIKLITTHIRAERFSDGHFAEMVRVGHILEILRRLAQLEPR